MRLTDEQQRKRGGERGEAARIAVGQQIAAGGFLCRIRVTQEDGAQAWTSPVYLDVE